MSLLISKYPELPTLSWVEELHREVPLSPTWWFDFSDFLYNKSENVQERALTFMKILDYVLKDKCEALYNSNFCVPCKPHESSLFFEFCLFEFFYS